jgi:hypothetical protein
VRFEECRVVREGLPGRGCVISLVDSSAVRTNYYTESHLLLLRERVDHPPFHQRWNLRG